MPKRGSKVGPYSQRWTGACAWCGASYRSVKADRQFCGPTCRTRWNRFKGRCGFTPELPVGPVGVAAAIAAVVDELLAAEARRRRTAAKKNGRAQKA